MRVMDPYSPPRLLDHLHAVTALAVEQVLDGARDMVQEVHLRHPLRRAGGRRGGAGARKVELKLIFILKGTVITFCQI